MRVRLLWSPEQRFVQELTAANLASTYSEGVLSKLYADAFLHCVFVYLFEVKKGV